MPGAVTGEAYAGDEGERVCKGGGKAGGVEGGGCGAEAHMRCWAEQVRAHAHARTHAQR
jgi:hypothetical protein